MLRGSIGKALAGFVFVAGSVVAVSAYASPVGGTLDPATPPRIQSNTSDLNILSVPIPPSVLLLGSALVGMMAMGRRVGKKRKSLVAPQDEDHPK